MSKKDDALKLALEALKETLRTLDDENAKPGGAISDTIWYSEHETLFDYMEAQITAIREALAEQPAQPAQPAQQEPVAWPHKWGCRANAFGECNMGCTSPQPAIPQGWRLVPVEPTMNMIFAMRRTDTYGDAWTEALNAAPQPQGEQK